MYRSGSERTSTLREASLPNPPRPSASAASPSVAPHTRRSARPASPGKEVRAPLVRGRRRKYAAVRAHDDERLVTRSCLQGLHDERLDLVQGLVTPLVRACPLWARRRPVALPATAGSWRASNSRSRASCSSCSPARTLRRLRRRSAKYVTREGPKVGETVRRWHSASGHGRSRARPRMGLQATPRAEIVARLPALKAGGERGERQGSGDESEQTNAHWMSP
jgi:hypothetical protein